MDWVKVSRSQDLLPGQKIAATVAGVDLLICRLSESEAHAVEDRCSHADAPLNGGTLDGAVIECPLHGGQFDIRNGGALRMPAMTAIETFPARITPDGWIEVSVQE